MIPPSLYVHGYQIQSPLVTGLEQEVSYFAGAKRIGLPGSLDDNASYQFVK